MESDLVEITLKLLDERRERFTRDEIAVAAGVNPHWLEKFGQRRIPNPTYRNLQALHRYLSASGSAVGESVVSKVA